MRFFNTDGPVNCQYHYCLPPLERINLDELLVLIERQKCFLLHAPRQTGKTTYLLALTEYLNQANRTSTARSQSGACDAAARCREQTSEVLKTSEVWRHGSAHVEITVMAAQVASVYAAPPTVIPTRTFKMNLFPLLVERLDCGRITAPTNDSLADRPNRRV